MSATKGPSPGALRKRQHDQRKRDAGLVEFRAWVTKKEQLKLRVALLNLRHNGMKTWYQST